jgi:hypothetical protein
MKSNNNSRYEDKKEVIDLAKMLSKMPKATNFNNSKSSKYFSSKEKKETDDYFGDGTMTIKDNLLHQPLNNSKNQTLHTTTSINKEHTQSKIFNKIISTNQNSSFKTLHQRMPSNILKVSKEIVSHIMY